MGVLNCQACGSGIGPDDLACGRCGAQVPRSAEDKSAIQSGKLLSGVVTDFKAGQGPWGVFIHAGFLIGSIIPIFVWVPIIVAFVFRDGGARRHARACLWFTLDRYLLVLFVTAALLPAGLIGSVLGAWIGSMAGKGSFQSQFIAGGGVALISIGAVLALVEICIYISGLICYVKAAAAARDGSWFIYPVYLVDPWRTQPR